MNPSGPGDRGHNQLTAGFFGRPAVGLGILRCGNRANDMPRHRCRLVLQGACSTPSPRIQSCKQAFIFIFVIKLIFLVPPATRYHHGHQDSREGHNAHDKKHGKPHHHKRHVGTQDVKLGPTGSPGKVNSPVAGPPGKIETCPHGNALAIATPTRTAGLSACGCFPQLSSS